MSKFFANIALIGLSWLVGAWTLMIGVGVVHAEWIPQLPTIGYALALLLSFLILVRAVIGSVFKVIVEAVNGGDR